MSLSKQLLILISALFLMIFGLNFALSIGNIKDYLEGESKVHAQDTAISLGLSLSPYMNDTKNPVINTMMSAIFDMGYYREIRLVDEENKELVSLLSDVETTEVPQWFIDLLPMTSATAESEINTDQHMTGLVYVTINSNPAYLKLYQQAKTTFYYSCVAFAISIGLLALVLRMSLASLNKINLLAQAISEGQFNSIEPLPWTREVRNVALSMNAMSRKIKTTITNLHHKLDDMGGNLLHDDLTGLYKKSVFETDLKYLSQEHGNAFIALIKIDSLAELVKIHDSNSIDNFLQSVAQILQNSSSQQLPVTAYRFYGAEFALLIKTDRADVVEVLIESISQKLSTLGEGYQKSDLAHIGVVRFNPIGTTENILKLAHEAYEQAQLIGKNQYFIQTGDHAGRDISAWKELVFNCVAQRAYSVWFIGQTIDFVDKSLLMEEAFIQVHDQNDQLVPIGPFIAIAEKFAKIVELDKGVISLAVEHIQHNHVEHAIAVNISTRTIKNGTFMMWLENLLKQNPAARQLVFSLSAYAVIKDTESYREFIESIHRWGAKAMIKRFETQSMSAEMIKKLKPDFIRLARDIGNGIDASSQKYAFVQTMQEMSTLLDIAILAENVQADEDYRILKSIGIVGASR